MIPRIINFNIAPNPQMLKACVNPNGCSKRVSQLQMIDGTWVELCYCPVWGATMSGRTVIYDCGVRIKQKVE